MSREDEHHLVDVLRLRSGALVIASNGRGEFVPCSLALARRSTKGSSATLDVEGSRRVVPARVRAIAVGFALHKADRPDWAVQKLTELGIDRILLLMTDRTVVRPNSADGTRRADRLERIARQAASQARVPFLPSIEGPMGLDEALSSAPSPVAIAEPGAAFIAAATATILVGPEGGFTDDELARSADKVGLADSILRTETAAVAAGVLLTALRAGSIAPR